ncbi:MAG: pilus assembly FimT family protein [Vicinamibacterales bacterium]
MTRFTMGIPGYSLLELMLAMSLGATLTAAAVPQYLASLDDLRASAAAHHVLGRLQRARMEAVMRSAMVGVLFTQAPEGGYSYAVYLDGNRNGVLTRDVQRGVDPLIASGERLSDQFAGVEFGAVSGLPPVDPGGTAPGADPIRLGSGNVASFSALGSATSGTLYIRSRRDAQYAVRVYGETGKTRVLKFDSRTRRWKQV